MAKKNWDGGKTWRRKSITVKEHEEIMREMVLKLSKAENWAIEAKERIDNFEVIAIGLFVMGVAIGFGLARIFAIN